MTQEDILALIQQDDWMMKVLQVAASLGLPDWVIGAGFVRNKVWNNLSGIEETHSTDVDVAYFDKSDINESTEKLHEASLRRKFPTDWSVKNLARMHTVNGSGDKPYLTSEDAIAHWPETATCVAVRLNQKGKLKLIAPYGVDDLVNLTVRPSPLHSSPEQVQARVVKKRWLERWPKLRIIGAS